MHDYQKLRERCAKVRALAANEDLSSRGASGPVEMGNGLDDNWIAEVLKEEAKNSQAATAISETATSPQVTMPEANGPAPEGSPETVAESVAAQPEALVADDSVGGDSANTTLQTNDFTPPAEEAIDFARSAETAAPDDPVKLVEPGEYKDPRIVIRGVVEEIFPTKTNVYGKAQRSARVRQPDGTTVLVSAFQDDIKHLDRVQPGHTFEFRGVLKEKAGSVYLNLR